MSRSILTLSMQKRKSEFEVKVKITRSEISKTIPPKIEIFVQWNLDMTNFEIINDILRLHYRMILN